MAKYQVDLDRELTIIESTTIFIEADSPPTLAEAVAWLDKIQGQNDYELGDTIDSTPWMIRQVETIA